MQVVACCLFACGSLLLGRAWSIRCTASPDPLVPDQTLYRIDEDSRIPDVNGSDYEYSWALGKQVIANHHETESGLGVVSHSINDLVASGCFDNMTFTRIFLSQNIVDTVLCKPNCTLNALLRSQKQTEIEAAVGVTVAVGAAVGAAVCVLLMVLLGVCLWYKFKDQISSRRTPRCSYAAVKTQNPRPAEEGNV